MCFDACKTRVLFILDQYTYYTSSQVGQHLGKGYIQKLRSIMTIYGEALSNANKKTVHTHGDLSPDNILVDKNKYDVSLITLIFYGFDESLIWCLDWKTSIQDTFDVVNALLKVKNFDAVNASQLPTLVLVDADTFNENMDTYDFLVALNTFLEQRGLLICELGRGNDSYEVFILEKKDYAAFLDSVKSLGYSISKLS